MSDGLPSLESGRQDVPAVTADGSDERAAADAKILAVAAALGIEPESGPEQEAAAAGLPAAPPSPDPAAVPTSSAEPASQAQHSAPVPDPADPTAARLEATLLAQLRSLEVSFRPDAPHGSSATALGPGADAGDAVPPPAGPPERSPFAPDPVRQRTYVDLRDPAPAPDRSAPDDAPWRKYLVEPGQRRSRPAPARSPAPIRPASSAPIPPAPVLAALPEERGVGFRAMSLAALLGLGVGLGLLAFTHPFLTGESEAVTAAAPPLDDPDGVAVASAVPAPAETTRSPAEASADAAAASPDGPVGQALATLLADSKPAHGTAVISEPGTGPTAADTIASAASPPVISPPHGEAVRVARVPDFDAAASAPLGYAPSVPSFDPVRRSLLDDEAAQPEPVDEPVAETTPAKPPPARPAPPPVRAAVPGRAAINTFVNMRAQPDNGAPVVAILAEGLAVKVVSCDYWCEIEAGGKRGYVFKKFISQ